MFQTIIFYYAVTVIEWLDKCENKMILVEMRPMELFGNNGKKLNSFS